MNSNKGMDPMLSCFVGDSIWNTKIIADIELPSSQFLPLTSADPSDPASPVPDSMLDSPGINNSSFADLASLWNTERKRVTSVKTEDDEGFSDVGSSMMDTEDEIIHGSISPVPDDVSVEDSGDESLCKYDTNCGDSRNFLISSESDARRYVEDKFLQIAYVPNPRSSQREKIQFILSLSDCKEYTLDQILNLDKKNSESARVCSKIVQNIPQRYRWECVTPEQIPCCYTIVADCKKTSSRDKPPRPMNAFMIWAQGARRLINELCPKMQNAAISEALGYCWRQKPDSFKKRFEIEKAKLRRFHNYEFPEYKYKPKTKVQKAKEKEELSLSKAKLAKTATKRKRPCDIPPKDPPVRKGKCGRPKKIKLTPEKEQRNPPKSVSPPHQTQTEQPVKIPPTKPAIKDMLTLKILNDRRTKEMAIMNSPPRETVQHSLGQLSPIEVESPQTADIFDELRELDSIHVANPICTGRELGSQHIMSSSVYDTPANTPPVDLDDDTRLSPINTLKIHTSSFVSKVSTSSPNSSSSAHSTAEFSHSPKNTNNKCLLSPQASMPSLTAILSSGCHIPPRNSQTSAAALVSPRLPLAQCNNGPQSNSFLVADRRNNRLSSTDVILSCVSEILDFPDPKKDIKPGDFLSRDNNNNSYYENNNNINNNNNNNNNNCSNNNNSFRLFDGFNSATTSANCLSGMLNPKLSSFGSSKIFDFNDLDTLCPDLSVPLLSDDVMSSLMNSL